MVYSIAYLPKLLTYISTFKCHRNGLLGYLGISSGLYLRRWALILHLLQYLQAGMGPANEHRLHPSSPMELAYK